MLTSPELTVIGIIAILLGLIAFTRLRIDLIALLVLLMVALARLAPAAIGIASLPAGRRALQPTVFPNL